MNEVSLQMQLTVLAGLVLVMLGIWLFERRRR